MEGIINGENVNYYVVFGRSELGLNQIRYASGWANFGAEIGPLSGQFRGQISEFSVFVFFSYANYVIEMESVINGENVIYYVIFGKSELGLNQIQFASK